MTAVNAYVELHRVLANPLADLSANRIPNRPHMHGAHIDLLFAKRVQSRNYPKYSHPVCQSICESRFATP